jgi:hypothetical protein
MNQSDLSIDKPADQHLLTIGDRLKDGVDVMTLRMCPPSTSDWFADDSFGKAWCGPFSGGENYAMLSNKGQGLFSC